MDWFSWLSKSKLESSIVYEYALAFAQNELEENDIAHFNHEFLQSMGITIAKHRLEILKLARKEKGQTHGLTFKHLFSILRKTKKSLTNCIATLVHGKDSSKALIVLTNKNKLKKKNKVIGGAISYSARWKRAMMMRKLMVNNGINNQEKSRLSNSNSDYYGDCDGDDDTMVVSSPKLDCYSSTLMHDLQQNTKEEKIISHEDEDQEDENQENDQQWTPSLEEIKWDAMFQHLKPN